MLKVCEFGNDRSAPANGFGNLNSDLCGRDWLYLQSASSVILTDPDQLQRYGCLGKLKLPNLGRDGPDVLQRQP
jgi:hypothetical protein